MHHDPTFWLIARASGLAAYAMLTLSVLAGLVLKSRPFARLKAAQVTEVHKTLALTGLGALALHAAALVLDTTVKVSLAALVVPGLVSYRPAAVAAGVVGGWLFVVVTVSFWLRKRIGARRWRRLHWFTYALFGLATVHGITAGTDAVQPWAHGLYLGAMGSVAGATAWRALVPPARRAPLKRDLASE
ncbi:MAG TPA: ferric reductase-like transmembrane domain-containing protein [Gaiellaceae bacterium]|nr:ferric reductase-like transmembrane domain-containing protein [Gaiellaceae bacterium]